MSLWLPPAYFAPELHHHTSDGNGKIMDLFSGVSLGGVIRVSGNNGQGAILTQLDLFQGGVVAIDINHAVLSRFATGRFPDDDHVASEVVGPHAVALHLEGKIFSASAAHGGGDFLPI